MMSIFKESRAESIARELQTRNYDHLLEQTMKVCDLEENLEMLLYDVADSIRSDSILLVSAGDNRETAYLIPVLLAYQNSNYFKKFIIATDSEAAKTKIIQKIQGISLLLGLHIPIHPLQPQENYLCLRRLKKHAKDKTNTTFQRVEVINGLYPAYYERKNYRELSDDEWEKIHVKSCSFSKCQYYRECKYRLQYQTLFQEGCFIVPQETVIHNVRYKVIEPVTNDTNIIIVDNAEHFAENVRKSYINSMHWKAVSKYIQSSERFLTKLGSNVLSAQDFEDFKEFWNILGQSDSNLWMTKDLQRRAKKIALKLKDIQIALTRTAYLPKFQLQYDHINDILCVIENFFADIGEGGKKYEYTMYNRETQKNLPPAYSVEMEYIPKKINSVIQESIDKTNCSFVFVDEHFGEDDGEYHQFLEDTGLEQTNKEIIKEYVYK